MELTQNMKVGASWKPVQSGIRLTTKSIMSLHENLVVKGELTFLLAGRFSQDALENIFSQIRSKGVMHPKPIQFRLSLRLICLAQFMSVPSKSSYEDEETPQLIDFIKSNKEVYSINNSIFADKNDNAALDLLSSATSCSDICESNGFYYAAGWAIYKELCKINCETCKTAFSVNEPNPQLKCYSLLTELKSFSSSANTSSKNYLCHPSKQIFDLLIKCEIIFRNKINYYKNHVAPEKLILNEVEYEKEQFPHCHIQVENILERYIKLRLHIFADELSKKFLTKVQFAGKFAARSCIN